MERSFCALRLRETHLALEIAICVSADAGPTTSDSSHLLEGCYWGYLKRTEGGKYLLLTPGHDTKVPDGYIAMPSMRPRSPPYADTALT